MAAKIEIIFTEEFKKNYQKLPHTIQKKLDKQLRFLVSNPKHPSLKIHKLNGDWEFYVDVHYRCFFQRGGNTYFLLSIGTHKIIERYKIQ
jgi:mRNA interferase RelE/StbE